MGEATRRTGNLACTYIVGRYHNNGGNTRAASFRDNVIKGRFNPRNTCNQMKFISLKYLLNDDAVKRNLKTIERRDGKLVHRAHRPYPNPYIPKPGNRGSAKKRTPYLSNRFPPHVPLESTSSSLSSSSFANKGLAAHNAFRCIHGAHMMRLDPLMTSQAEEYARTLSTVGRLVHSYSVDVGESLAYGCSPVEEYEMSAAEATRSW